MMPIWFMQIGISMRLGFTIAIPLAPVILPGLPFGKAWQKRMKIIHLLSSASRMKATRVIMLTNEIILSGN
jgi:hypothetical protein